MITAAAFVLLAAAGAVARGVATAHLPLASGFPTGTFLVNVAGSFGLGLLDGRAGPGATVVGVGLLGALTTFSGVARDVAEAGAGGRHVAGVAYAAASCAAGTAAAALGLQLG